MFLGQSSRTWLIDQPKEGPCPRTGAGNPNRSKYLFFELATVAIFCGTTRNSLTRIDPIFVVRRGDKPGEVSELKSENTFINFPKFEEEGKFRFSSSPFLFSGTFNKDVPSLHRPWPDLIKEPKSTLRPARNPLLAFHSDFIS